MCELTAFLRIEDLTNRALAEAFQRNCDSKRRARPGDEALQSTAGISMGFCAILCQYVQSEIANKSQHGSIIQLSNLQSSTIRHYPSTMYLCEAVFPVCQDAFDALQLGIPHCIHP